MYFMEYLYFSKLIRLFYIALAFKAHDRFTQLASNFKDF